MSIRFTVRLKPGARKNSIHGWQRDPHARQTDNPNAAGDSYLLVSVTAAPLEGKANKMLTTVLAKALGLPRSAVHIVRGETSRIKQVEVPDDSNLDGMGPRQT